MAKLGAEMTVLVPQVWAPPFMKHFKKWRPYTQKRQPCHFEGLKAIAVNYLRITGNWWYRWDGLSVYLALRKRALELHRSESFDIVFSACLFPDGDAAVRLGRYLELPSACMAIGTDVTLIPDYTRSLQKHFSHVTNSLTGTLAHGHSIAKKIEDTCGKRTPVVHGSVDLECFSPAIDKTQLRKELDIKKGSIALIYAGYLTKNKGIYEMVEAVSCVHKICLSISLNICGAGIEEAGIRQLIARKNAGDYIRLVGNVDPDKMHKWMKASDLFVLATYYEGMPNVVMEAMACGLPVVSTMVGGLPAAVGDCDGAILIEPKNIDALTEAIMRVVQDKKLRDHMGKEARKKAEEKFGVMRNARVILEHLESIVKQNQ